MQITKFKFGKIWLYFRFSDPNFRPKRAEIKIRSSTTFGELLILEASAVGVDQDVLHELLHESLPAAWVVAIGLNVGDGREVPLPPQSVLLSDVNQENGS